jgi:hypothetical protein
MRLAAAFVLALAASVAFPQRVLLVPLDNRPAAGQFAQMIGAIAGAEVRLPPYDSLGQFTRPGSPAQVLSWLEGQDYSHVSAVVVSTDMIAYGGLIASRTNMTSYAEAITRLNLLADIRRKHPEVKFFAFSAVTRVLPTATHAAAPWRLQLGKYVELREAALGGRGAEVTRELDRLRAHIPQAEILRYDHMRARNLNVQLELVRMTADGTFDYLMLGQDDASPVGPHIRETEQLHRDVDDRGIQSKVYFCEGIDQQSNVLVSRALLREAGFVPYVKVVYSDEDGKKVYASFEAQPLERSVEDQLFASGARPADPNGPYDYALYLNTPNPRPDRFAQFTRALQADIDRGVPVAVADVNLSSRVAADPKLVDALSENRRLPKLLSYAGWNTAGNTVGTSIPAANMAVLGRRDSVGTLQKELAREEFLLHRLVNDYAYHRFTRPMAYALIANLGTSGREEIYGDTYATVSSFVRRDLKAYLERYFQEQFEGESVVADGKTSTVEALDREIIWLPWPRAYEVRLEFHMLTR